MSTFRQLNVSGGELAPALYPRTDTSKFQAGFRTMRNIYVRKDGSLENRQGSAKRAKTSRSKKVFVMEFRVTQEDSYQVELSDLRLRILRWGIPAPLLSWGSREIVSITKANPGVLKFSGVSDLSNGQEILVSGVNSGMTEINNKTFIVTGLDAVNKTFNLVDDEGNNVDTTGWGTFVPSSTRVITRNVVFNSPWTETEIESVDYDQSIDVMKIVHINHPPIELKRNATNWSLYNVPFGVIPAPVLTGLNISAYGAGGSTGTVRYAVTSVDANNEESGASVVTDVANISPTSTYYNQLGWNSPTAGMTFYIYKQYNGVYGLIGKVIAATAGYVANQFRDVGVTPDTTHTLADYINPFNGVGNYPSCVTYFQQRTVYAHTLNKPETVFASQTGIYDSFIKRPPGDTIRDSDSIEFNLAGKSINPVHFLFDLNGLVMMTESSEQYLGNEAMTPSSIQPQAQSYNGTRQGVRPVQINNTAVYLQALGSVVRELGYQYEVDGYRGDDLTTFSAHLFKNKKIVSMSYQQIPNSVIWFVRNDGIVLTLTHVKEQQILAWSHHDFEGGFVERVFCCREGSEDVVYAIVLRSVNGVSKRYYERLPSRNITGLDDCHFMDSHVTYNGMNTEALYTMTINDPTGVWDYETLMDISSNGSFFDAQLVGKEIHVFNGDDVIRFTVDSITSPLSAKGRPHKTVPVSMRNIALSTWGFAVNEISGLSHLEGRYISAFGDGNVICSPHNSTVEYAAAVTNGKLALDKFYVRVTAGMPITADLETLDIDTVNGETMVDKYKNIGKITFQVEETRGIFAGGKAPDDSVDFLDGLTEVLPRFEEGYEDPNRLITGKMDVIIQSHWNSNGRVFIRQVDPLPVSILSVAPAGFIPYGNN